MSIINKGNQKDDDGKDPKTGRFVAGNKYGFKPGQSGNPKGRPPKKAILKELDKNLGDVPRQVLYQVLDQAANGTRHFGASSPIGKAIKRMGVKDFITIATYLDEQANGKAKATTELEGALIVLSDTADQL